MNNLDNKVAVVTGGATGLGQNIAAHLSFLGARVIIADIEDSSETLSMIADKGRSASAFRCNLADEGSVKAFGDFISDVREGQVDILINNAGLNGECNLLDHMPAAVWEETLRINLTGTMLMTRTLIPMLVAAGGGQIVNVASNTSRRGVPWHADYACSKWAMIGFTQCLARELASRNIRANVVNPGPVTGDRIESIINNQAEAVGKSPDKVRSDWLSAIPMRRFVDPSEVAQVVGYLCSSRSSALTGQALEVSSGLIMR